MFVIAFLILLIFRVRVSAFLILLIFVILVEFRSDVLKCSLPAGGWLEHAGREHSGQWRSADQLPCLPDMAAAAPLQRPTTAWPQHDFHSAVLP